MLHKILIGLGISLGAILFVENAVLGAYAYIFLDTSASAGSLVLVSIIIGMMIGFGLKGFLSAKKIDDEFTDTDF